MSSRVDTPWKTVFRLAVLAALAWGGYELVVVRGVLRPAPAADAPVPEEVVREIHDRVAEEYRNDPCYLGVGPIVHRPRENRYRVDLLVDAGCAGQAKGMCQEVSELVARITRADVEVWAYTSSYAPLARYVP